MNRIFLTFLDRLVEQARKGSAVVVGQGHLIPSPPNRLPVYLVRHTVAALQTIWGRDVPIKVKVRRA